MTVTASDNSRFAARSGPSNPASVWEWISVFLLFVLLTLWYTNPLWKHPGTFLVDGGDPLGNAAIQWWLSQKILSGHLGGLWSLPPYFYPASPSLIFNDPQIGATLLGLPFFAATGNAILAYNAVVLLSFPLCALGAYALVRHLTASAGAAVFAGVAWGFSIWHLGHIAHQQLLSLEFLPLLLLALHRYGETKANRFLPGVFACWLAQACMAEYWGMFLVLLVVPFALLLLRVSYRLTWRETGRAFAAVGLALAAWMPLQIPFLIASKHGIHHSLSLIMRIGADVLDYLPPPGTWLWGGWSGMSSGHRGDREYWISPGLVVLTAALITSAGLWRYQRRPAAGGAMAPGRRLFAPGLFWGTGAAALALFWVWMRHAGKTALTPFPDFIIDRGSLVRLCVACVGMGLAAHLQKKHRLLARDPRSPLLPYAALAMLAVVWSCGYDIHVGGVLLMPGLHRLLVALPGGKSFRAVGRMGAFADLAMVVLASAWVASTLARLPQRGGRGLQAVFAASLCALVLAENLTRTGTAIWGLTHDWRPASRQADRWLAVQPSAPMIELPLTDDHYLESVRMWRQLTFYKPMRNGQGTFVPPDYSRDVLTFSHPQSANAVARLRALKVKYVLLDSGKQDVDRLDSLQRVLGTSPTTVPGMPPLLPPPYRLAFADAEVKIYALPPAAP